MPINERDFQTWYAGHAKALKLSPDPDDPKQFYDYRAAFEAGATPDKTGHWPSKYKKEGHPNLIVDGVNTKTGEPVPPPQSRIGGNKFADYRTEQDMYTLAKSGKFAGIKTGRESVADEMWGLEGKGAPPPSFSNMGGGSIIARDAGKNIFGGDPDYIPTGLWRIREKLGLPGLGLKR